MGAFGKAGSSLLEGGLGVAILERLTWKEVGGGAKDVHVWEQLRRNELTEGPRGTNANWDIVGGKDVCEQKPEAVVGTKGGRFFNTCSVAHMRITFRKSDCGVFWTV